MKFCVITHQLIYLKLFIICTYLIFGWISTIKVYPDTTATLNSDLNYKSC